MLLRFFRMGFTLFSVLSVIGMTSLAPINYYAKAPPPVDHGNGTLPGGKNSTSWNVDFDETLLLRLITVENVPQV